MQIHYMRRIYIDHCLALSMDEFMLPLAETSLFDLLQRVQRPSVFLSHCKIKHEINYLNGKLPR